MSESPAKLSPNKEKIAALEKEKADLERENAELQAKLSAATPPLAWEDKQHFAYAKKKGRPGQW